MDSPGSSPDVTPEAVRQLFSQLAEPATPLTTAEVVRRTDCDEAAVERDLATLADRGVLRTRQQTTSDRSGGVRTRTGART